MPMLLGLFKNALPWWLLPVGAVAVVLGALFLLADRHIARTGERAEQAVLQAEELRGVSERLEQERDQVVAALEQARSAMQRADEIAADERKQSERLASRLAEATKRPVLLSKPKRLSDDQRDFLRFIDCLFDNAAAGTTAAGHCDSPGSANNPHGIEKLQATPASQ